MRNTIKVWLVLVLLPGAMGAVALPSAAAEPPPFKRVLLLLPFEASRPGSAVFLRGIQEGLKASYSGSVDISTENVGPIPPEPENFPAKIDDWIAYKYTRVKFDAIVAVTFPPARLGQDLRDRFWPGAGLLLVLIDEERWANPGLIPRSARVGLALDNKESVRSALIMLPNTQRVVVLGGASQRDRRTNTEIVKSIRELNAKLEIVDLTGLPMEEIKARISALPERTIIVIGSFLFLPSGQRMDVPQLVEEFNQVANAPLFADSDMSMGKGVVGGEIVSVQGAAEVAGEQLGQLLNGTDPESLPTREVKNSFIVDWRQLKRWGISESTLPKGATVLYRQSTAWEQYGRYIVGFVSVFVLLLFLVAFLLIERQRRQKEEDLNSAMLESLPGLAVLVNRQGVILRTNQVERQATAIADSEPDTARPGQMYSDYLSRLIGQEDGSAAVASIEPVIVGARASATAELPLSSVGRWIEVRALQLPKQQSGSLIVHLDITQRKQAELERTRSRTEIYHLNRVAAMGQLAASLAHELSQPLTAIMSNAEAAQRFAHLAAPDMVEICEALEDIARDDKRASAVIQRMRAMLKKENVAIEPVDLNQIATSVVQMIRNEVALRGMTIDLGLSATPVMVKGDQVGLQQVVLNLASNGLDAMAIASGGGHLAIRTAVEPSAGKIWVIDDGPGVSAEVRDKLFQPFFTTKTTGLGMGLSICHSIVESLGGRINLADADGKGAAFVVELPLA